ncbi:aminoglycoside phosphotransferase family protein [bacterium]|jgi:Ser/Thr protein kinase RdoA (MazF antagonist)|nr:aminoglycoside phosphotransferase family protein [bacterium]
MGFRVLEEPQFQANDTSVVIRFQTEQGRYLFRAPRLEPKQMQRILLAYSHFSQLEIMPGKIYADHLCLVEEYFEGTPLKANAKEAKLRELGELLQKLHTIRSKNYGKLIFGVSGEHQRIEDFVNWIDHDLKVVSDRNLLPEDGFKKLERILSDHRLANSNETYICHGDAGLGNILYSPMGIRMIDWDRICSMPREYEFFVLRTQFSNSQMLTLLKSYQANLNEKLIDWFALMNLIRLIALYDPNHPLVKIHLVKIDRFLETGEFRV